MQHTQNRKYFRNAIFYNNILYFLHNNKLYKRINKINILILEGFKITDFFVHENYILFISNKEIMILKNNEVKRLTYLSNVYRFAGFDNDKNIYFSTLTRVQSRYDFTIYKLTSNFSIEELNIDHCVFAHKQDTKYVLKFNGYAYRNWKNYKGGLAGRILITDNYKNYNEVDYITFNPNELKKIIKIKDSNAYETEDTLKYTTGNISESYIKGNRIYFCADFYGERHIYSCDFNGNNIIQHTKGSGSYFMLQMSLDGNLTAVKDGQIYLMENDTFNLIQIDNFNSSFINNKDVLLDAESMTVSDKGDINIISRGKSIFISNYQGNKIIQSNENYRESIYLDNNLLLLLGTNAQSDFFHLYNCKENKVYKLDLSQSKIDIGYVNKIIGNSKYFAFSNHKNELYSVKIEDNEATKTLDINSTRNGIINLVAVSKYKNINDFDILHNKIIFTGLNKIYSENECIIYDIDKNEKHIIKSDKSIVGNYLFKTKFDKKNKKIICLQHNNFNFSYSKYGFNMKENSDGISPILLDSFENNIFNFHNDIEDNKKDDTQDKTDNKKDKIENDKNKDDGFDISNINHYSFIKFPRVKFKNYVDIFSNGKNAYIIELINNKYNIYEYCFEEHAIKDIYKNIEYYKFSSSLEWLIISINKVFKILKTGDNFNTEDNSYKNNKIINFDNIKIEVNLKKEWKFIFDQVVRIHKNLFWREGVLKSIDKIADKYRNLIDFIETREDLNNIIAEFNGELQTSHIYILNSGELLDYDNKVQQDSIGYLGAKYKFCKEKNAYKIETIYSENSPLYQHSIREGSFILSINGVLVNERISINEMLRFSADKVVLLEIETDNKIKKFVSVKAIKSEDTLLYDYDLAQNRKDIKGYLKDIKSDKKIGYIHIPNMSTNGFNKFYSQYLSERLNDGLIIDVRHNKGGNTSSIIFEKLLGKLIGYDKNRYDEGITYPMECPPKNIILLANEHTCSDGDIFTFAFKTFKLGKVVGQRTWGGVVGICVSDINMLADGGSITSPGYPFFFGNNLKKNIDDKSDKKSCFIENIGVIPDIEVRGKNNQLKKAVELLVESIK